MKYTVLVVSLSAALNGLAQERLVKECLVDAVFFVSGSPFITFDDLRKEIRGDTPRGDAACHDVAGAIVEAESNGRLAWQEAGDKWQQLNQLLAANDLPPIDPIDQDCPKEGRYALRWVSQAAREQKLPYRVI